MWARTRAVIRAGVGSEIGERRRLRGEALEDVDALREPRLLVRLHGGPLHAFEAREFLLDRLAALGDHLCDVGDFLVVAARALGVLGVALGQHVVLDVLPERVQIAPALVRFGVLLARAIRPVLDRGVAPDAHVAAQVLVLCAVDVADQNRRVPLVLPHEAVPGRFHRLAVPSPGRQELDEAVLAGAEHLCLEGVARELQGRGGRRCQQKDAHCARLRAYRSQHAPCSVSRYLRCLRYRTFTGPILSGYLTRISETRIVKLR